MSISAKMLGQITLGASAESPEIITGIQKSSNDILGNAIIRSPIETIELKDYIIISVTTIKSIVVFKKSDTPNFIGIYQVASGSSRGAKICKSGDNNLIGIWTIGRSIFACSIFISEDIVSIGSTYTITTDIYNSEKGLSACSCGNTAVIIYTEYTYSSTSATTYGVSAYAMTSSGTSITIGTKKVLVANVATNIPVSIKACGYSNTKLIAGWYIDQLKTTYFHQLTLSELTITTGASTTFVGGDGTNINSIMSNSNYYNYTYYTYANLGNANICVFPYAYTSGYYGYFSIVPSTLTAGDYEDNVQILSSIANDNIYLCQSYALKKEDPKNPGNFITLNQKLLNSISYKSMVVGMTNEYAVLYINRGDESALGKFVCVKYIENGINIYPKGSENETALVIGESGKTKEISSLYFECKTNVSESTDISLYYDDIAVYTENVENSSKILLSNSPIVLNVGNSIVPKIKKGYSAVTITAFGLEETV